MGPSKLTSGALSRHVPYYHCPCPLSNVPCHYQDRPFPDASYQMLTFIYLAAWNGQLLRLDLSWFAYGVRTLRIKPV